MTAKVMACDAPPVITKVVAIVALLAGLWLLLMPYTTIAEGSDLRCAPAVDVESGHPCSAEASVRRDQATMTLLVAGVIGLVLLRRAMAAQPATSTLAEKLRRIAKPNST